LPKLEPAKLVDFDASIGAYDLHSYTAVFDSMSGGYPLRVAAQRLAEWAKFAHDRGKPFFLSELGTMGFGWGNEDPGPASYESGLKARSKMIGWVLASAVTTQLPTQFRSHGTDFFGCLQ